MVWTCIHLINYIHYYDIKERGSSFMTCITHTHIHQLKINYSKIGICLKSSALKLFSFFLKTFYDHLRQSTNVLPFRFQYHILDSIIGGEVFRWVHTYTVEDIHCDSLLSGICIIDGKSRKDWKLMQLTCYNLQSSLKNTAAVCESKTLERWEESERWY